MTNFPAPTDRTVIFLGGGFHFEGYWHPVLEAVRPVVEPAANTDGAIMFGRIRRRPGDRTAELVYADWCDEQGDPALAEQAADIRQGFWRSRLTRFWAGPVLVGNTVVDPVGGRVLSPDELPDHLLGEMREYHPAAGVVPRHALPEVMFASTRGVRANSNVGVVVGNGPDRGACYRLKRERTSTRTGSWDWTKLSLMLLSELPESFDVRPILSARLSASSSAKGGAA